MTPLTNFIIDSLNTHYGIEVIALALLPLGADMNASLYKVQASEKTYFVKLKQGQFDDASITIITLLQKAGIKQLICPAKTVVGKDTYQEGDLTLIVYPFVQGQDGFSRSLTDEQWVILGQALKNIHETSIPKSLQTQLRKENFSPKWRDFVRSLYDKIETEYLDDETALKLFKFLQENKQIILQLVERSEELSQKAQRQPLKFVLCHSDIHGGNVLLDDKENLYIVDWDDPILAPKERDLMFIGGGVGNVWNKPHEEKLFYQGYGQVDVNWVLLAYYRYERIVQDIAEYAQELLLRPTQNKDKKDKLEMYKQFISMFTPNGVVDIAIATGKQIVAENRCF